MDSNRTLTRRWLREHIVSYTRHDIVFQHVDAVLDAHPTLRPKTDVYTFDDGRSQLMLCVHGLLPIVYRQTTYHIPVAVWLPHAYPADPPMVYVVPTSDMLVKASKHVDVSGRCTFQYTQAWQTKSEGCHLLALIDVLIDAFSAQPPLYAKPQRPPSSSSSSSSPVPNYSTRPPRTPPPPPPPLPPHPTSNPRTEPPTYSRPSSSSSIPYYAARPPPPVPPRQLSSPTPSQPSVYYPPQSQHPPLQSPPPPPPQIHHPYQPIQSPPQPPLPTHLPPHPPPQQPTRNYLEEDIEDIPPITSQQTTAPPPPRPPNPEILKLHIDVLNKLNSEYSALEYALNTDLQRLRTAQSDLLAGEAAIHDEIGRLHAVSDVCRTVADRYRATIHTAQSNLAELRKKGDPELDELICSTSIIYNQLIDLVAEDNAIEDTIYHLHRALNTGKLDLEKFLRITRALAEEQFMKRALAQKIISSVPMSAWGYTTNH